MNFKKDLQGIAKAVRYALIAHEGQRRKYEDEPYIMHPARVAMRVALLDEEYLGVMISAAYLHDVIEDAFFTKEDLRGEFALDVVKTVVELTNPSIGSTLPRDERKKIDREHLAKVSREAKIIKALDRIDNLEGLGKCDKKNFVELYYNESILLYEIIKDVLPLSVKELWKRTMETVERSLQRKK